MSEYVHKDPDFADLVAIVSARSGIHQSLVEKDYWIMHTLYSMKKQGLEFELKGGTSLSKGFGLIHRFSEDIDIHLLSNFGLNTEGKEDSRKVREARRNFYDLLAQNLSIDGIEDIKRDFSFDDKIKYRSGGIRLNYTSVTSGIEGLKNGILLEAGFDQTAPNIPCNISSWIWDYLVSVNAADNYINNNAIEIFCYHPGHTLIEKLQTIIRKYRIWKKNPDMGSMNFMRQYYDVYCLLNNREVLQFVATEDYAKHKKVRIKGEDGAIPLSVHPALLLDDDKVVQEFMNMYRKTASLYYRGQPDFREMISRIRDCMNML